MMGSPTAAVPGMDKLEIDTPALLIDVERMEANIAAMAGFFARVPADLRPHFKTHKSPILAHKQIAAGAIGITCAKLGEAEILVNAGIESILIANQIVGATKVSHLAGLARHAHLIVAVDNPENVRQLSKAARQAGSTIHVVVEVDVGMAALRCAAWAGGG